MALWADVLIAMDDPWWAMYYEEVRASFKGARYCVNEPKGGRQIAAVAKPFNSYSNSGASAISFAIKAGAARIILLGYDCQHTGGQAHWHGNHPSKLGNAAHIHKWLAKFDKVAKDAAGVEIINCTRETALKSFPRRQLEEVL